MSQLKVFVSSTCYDLTQIRADLVDCLLGFGYQPILSEYSNFPIDPDNDTIENCIQNVNTADILILIIGNRYGYIADTGKSITNTEYLYAKQKGIPIYIFILKSLITILPIWKKNKQADFSDSIDSVQVFEFVDELRNGNKNWCFDFEKAQEIIQTLKVQFSHLFKSSLDIRKKFNISQQPDYWENLSTQAINIALNKNEMFELLFFIQVLKDELAKYDDLKLDLDYYILLGCNKYIQEPKELVGWLYEKLQSLYQFINSGTNLVNNAFGKYYGELGQPADLKGLYYVASSMARLFKEMILWSIDIRSTYVIDDFASLKETFAKLIITSAIEIWDYPNKAQKDIDYALELTKKGLEGKINSIITFSIEKEYSDFFSSEMKRLTRKYGSI